MLYAQEDGHGSIVTANSVAPSKCLIQKKCFIYSLDNQSFFGINYANDDDNDDDDDGDDDDGDNNNNNNNNNSF